MLRSPILASSLACLLATAVAVPALAAWTHDPVNGGVPISTTAYGKSQTLALADGAGGAFLAWCDQRNGAYQVYAQHLNAYGVPLWPVNGVAACASYSGGGQFTPTMDTDGSGGIIVSWCDTRAGNSDIYAQHFSSAGAATWGATGAVLCNAAAEQTGPSLVTDDAGGAYVCWSDARPATGMYYNHVYASGSTQWGAPGTNIITGLPMPGVRVARDGTGGVLAVMQYGTSTTEIYVVRLGIYGFLWGNFACVVAGDQLTPTICSDGAGGAIVAWTDKRSNANGDIFAQHMWYQGSTLWGASGVQVSTGTTTHSNPQIVTDNAGGGIVTWAELRSGYVGPAAQRLNSGGSAMWTSGGVLLSSGVATLQASLVSVAPDGLGGLLTSYADYRSGGADTWAQRLNAAGAPQWGATGVAANSNPAQDNESAICPDGRGGAIVAFIDGRGGMANGNYDLFASHLDSWGILGAEPVMASVRDVPNDNGGHVKVSWYASPLEADPLSVGVSEYLVLRSAPPNLVARAQRAGLVSMSPHAVATADPALRPLLAQPDGVNTYFWELVATQAAYHLPTYSVIAPTTGDSMGIGNPRTAFMVQAVNLGNGDYWASAPDSGYSTDNVPPIMPAPFTGTYTAGSATLHWNPNPDLDLANYRLYRGTTSSFIASPASLVATPADTGYVDAAGAPYYYRLSAVDIHGNESPAAALLPQGTLGVGGPGAPRELALRAPSPNPARGSVTVAFELPRPARVRVAVFDAAGRLVRTLADGARPAGTQSLAFDLRDERGRALGAGLYLVRLEAEGRVFTRRIAAVR